MAGANWTQRSYEAIADMTIEICKLVISDEEDGGMFRETIIETVIRNCIENSARTINGNRNFNDIRFRNYVAKGLEDAR